MAGAQRRSDSSGEWSQPGSNRRPPGCDIGDSGFAQARPRVTSALECRQLIVDLLSSVTRLVSRRMPRQHNAATQDLTPVVPQTALDSLAFKGVIVSCPVGKKVLGGGASLISPSTSVALSTSMPTSSGTGWHALAEEVTPTASVWLEVVGSRPITHASKQDLTPAVPVEARHKGRRNRCRRLPGNRHTGDPLRVFSVDLRPPYTG
jgi:hypothetical protein